MERKRLTSVKTNIKSVTSGKFIAQPGFEPNYVLTAKGMRLSRVRVLATVVDKFLSETGKFASVTLDDGSDTIRCKVFTALSLFDGVEEGDIVDVVARVREYQGEVFLVPEVIHRIEDPNWELLRELELRQMQSEWDRKRSTIFQYQKQASDLTELKRVLKERFAIVPEDVEAVVQSQEMITESAGEEDKSSKAKEAVLELISELDKGEGCDYSELLEKSGLGEDVIDTVVNELLEEGTCFEPRPGKIKRL